MNLQAIFKKALPHVVSLIVIITSISIYYAPQQDGKIIAGGDVVSATAWSKHVQDHEKETGEQSFWNTAMFSGMPWRLLKSGAEYNFLRHGEKVLRLWSAPPKGLVFKAGIIAYFSLVLLGISPYIALLCALAFGFNVNYVILLEAGHESKLAVLAMFPFLVTGLLLCFRKKWVIGMPLIAFTTSLAIFNNHIQMIYYLMLCFVIFGLVYIVYAIREKQAKTFMIMASLALFAAVIGAGSNFAMLNSASAFADDTMRGKPILKTSETVQAAPSSSTEDGLEWNYAMQWSNDKLDLASIFIPRIVGGSHYEEVGEKTALGRLLKQNNAPRGYDKTYQATLYWGQLPITSGPYYSSIIIISLFFLGFFLLPGKLNWAFGLMSLFIIVLSMGKHASWLNQPMFDLLPLLNKFRAPSSAITILPVFLIFGAAFSLDALVKKKKKETLIKPLLYSVGSVLGVSLLVALLGSSFLEFEGPGDARYPEQVKDVFRETRQALFSADAWRNVGYLVALLAVLFTYLKGYIKNSAIAIGILIPIVFIDLYTIDRRHLDKDNWEPRREYFDNFSMRPVDQQISKLEPKGRGYYRVFDIPNMRTSATSYNHNTIGGYHAAKLQRYQDMLDYYINKGSRGVLNMLNAKYTITSQNELEVNSQALGNAWAVTDVRFVNTANEEIEAVGGIDPGATAIVHQVEFPNAASTIQTGDGNCNIAMTDYAPNNWVYDFNSNDPEFVVFSEVWYNQEKGMTASIDGEPVDFVRANYLLRGLQVPAGKHTIEFSFKPVAKGASISLVSSALILLMLLYAFYDSYKGSSKLIEVIAPVALKKEKVTIRKKNKKK